MDNEDDALRLLGPEISQEYGRNLFLDAVRVICPKVLESLYAGPYQILEAMGWAKPAKGGKSAAVDFVERAKAARSELTLKALDKPKFRPLRKSLNEWAENWNLTDDWCKQAALDTLLCRRTLKLPGRRWRPRWYMLEEHLLNVPNFKFSHLLSLESDPPPFPADNIVEYRKKTRAQFREKVRTAQTQLKAELDKYLHQLKGPTLKSRPGESVRDEQLVWLAGYQLKGWAFYRIAKAMGSDDARTVSKQIRERATFIGLTLRDEEKNDLGQTADNIRQLLEELGAATIKPKKHKS